MRGDLEPNRSSSGLVDILDRVLDKGLVVAGDIRVSLAEVELLTIRIRLIVCSIDKAEQIGIDWWKYDPYLSGHRDELRLENESLREQLQALESRVAALTAAAEESAPPAADQESLEAKPSKDGGQDAG